MPRRRILKVDTNKDERENTLAKKRKEIDGDPDLGKEKSPLIPKKTKGLNGRKLVSVGDEKTKSVDEETKSADEENNNVASSSGNRRGKTVINKLYQLRLKGVRKQVDFNKLGKPIGHNNTEMQSYIGVLARELINVTYKKWKDVPKDVKDQIWESVNLSFIVIPEYYKGCLASANGKWRAYKSKLAKNFVYGRVGSPDLNSPPEDSGITQADWSNFVISRLIEGIKKYSSSAHKSLRNNVKYNHHLSRKGYANYAEENAYTLSGDPDIDRTTLWVHGSKNENGVFNGEELAETVMKMNEFIEQKKSGTGGSSHGILCPALNSSEYGGCVRGIENNDSLLKDIRERLEKLEALVYNRTCSKTTEENGSCSVKIHKLIENDVVSDDEVIHIDENEDMKGKAVELILSLRVGVAVALGTFIRTNRTTDKIHGMTCPKDSVLVSIDQTIDENVRLPFPTNEFEYVEDAIGSHVAWPKHLVKLQGSAKKKDNVEVQKPRLKKGSVPLSLWFVYCFAKFAKDIIEIPLDDDVFGDKLTLFVHFEDIDPFARLEPISATCIAIYIWHLYKQCVTLNKQKRFVFVNPWKVSASQSKDETIMDKYNENRSKDLATILASTTSNQLVLVPCNLTDGHWVLTIINPYKGDVCFIDPLYSIIDPEWKCVVDMAFKIFKVNATIKKVKKNSTWNIIKVPKQLDGAKCGYFVLRYMKDIIEFDGVVETNLMQSVFPQKNYSEKDIDDVREEWADCLSTYME